MKTKVKFMLGVIVASLVAGCATTPREPLSTLAEGQKGKIYFSGPSQTDLTEIISGKGYTETIIVYGKLMFPSSQKEKVPAVVINHSSGGVHDWREYRFARALNRKGMAAFVLYSFEARLGSKRRIQTAGSGVSIGMRIADAYQALNLLSTHPAIDPDRIGILGFSSGGVTSLLSADEKVRRELAKDDLKFAAHVCLYPSALFTYKNIAPTGSPMLLLLGEKDDICPADDCLRYAHKLEQSGVEVRTIVYPGANHAWDAPWQPKWIKKLTNSAPCHFDILDDGKLLDATTGELIPERKWAAQMKYCATQGATSGRDSKAAKKCLDDTVDFLVEVLVEQ